MVAGGLHGRRSCRRCATSISATRSTDVINVCRELDTSAVTAAYGPAMFGGTIAAVDGSKQTCLDVTGRAASRLLRFAMRTRAARARRRSPSPPMTLATKTALLQRSARTIARAADLTKRRILAACSGGDFDGRVRA